MHYTTEGLPYKRHALQIQNITTLEHLFFYFERLHTFCNGRNKAFLMDKTIEIERLLRENQQTVPPQRKFEPFYHK